MAVTSSVASAKRPIDPNHSTLTESGIAPMVACPEPQGWWQPVGSGLDDGNLRLHYNSSNHLYAGGGFTAAGPVSTSAIAKWNGTTWSPLGSGLNDAAYSLAIDSQDNVYVAGAFTQAGGVPANQIAKWNGASWSPLGTGLNSYGWALAIDSEDNVYVAGEFTQAGGVAANRIAKWDPTTSAWSALGTGLNNGAFSLAIDSQDNVYVAGEFTQAGGAPVNRIAKWNGTTWSPLGSGLNGLAFSLAIDLQDNVYVGGDFSDAGGAPANQIAKWNGASWSPLGPGLDGLPRSITIDNAHGLVYVAGDFTATAAAPIVNLNRVTVWDTRMNQFIPLLHGCSPNVAGLSGQSFSIAINPQDSRKFAIGGYFTNAGGNGADQIATWTWAPPEPTTGQLVDAYTGTTGSQVTFTGTKFIGVTGVQIGTTPVTNFTVIDPTTITMTVPGGLASGVPLDINVTAVGGTGSVATLTVPPAANTGVVPMWRVNANINGGVCQGLSTSTQYFLGYGYLPGPDECSRDGHTFGGWADTSAPTTPITFPLVVDPSTGTHRYFVSANHDVIAIWSPVTQVSLPAPVVFGTGSFFCRVCTSAVIFWQEPTGTPMGTEWTVTSQSGRRGLVNTFGSWRFSIVTGLTPGSTHSFTVVGRSTNVNSNPTQVTITVRNG